MWNTDNDLVLIKEIKINGGKETRALLKLSDIEIAAAGYDDGFIRTFEIPSLECTKSIKVHCNGCKIFKLCNLDANNLVSAGYEDKNVKIVNWKT